MMRMHVGGEIASVRPGGCPATCSVQHQRSCQQCLPLCHGKSVIDHCMQWLSGWVHVVS